jgi:CheY-like chemotaxis protein
MLWARRAAQQRRGMTAAQESAEIAKSAAATALAADARLLEFGTAVAEAPRRPARPAATVAAGGDRTMYRVASADAPLSPAPLEHGEQPNGDGPSQPEPAQPSSVVSEQAAEPVVERPWTADLGKPLDSHLHNPRTAAASAWAQNSTPAADPSSPALPPPVVPEATAPAAPSAWLNATPGSEPEAQAVFPPAVPGAESAVSNGSPDSSGADLIGAPARNASMWSAETAAARPEEPTPDPTAASPSYDVLLVEDDENVVKLYRLLLESQGMQVRHAGDGLIGLEEVQRKRPDLILLDVMMPRMNGITFLQSLRAMDDVYDVPVVVLSNFKEPRLVEQALSLGALEYRVKAQTRPEVLARAVPHWVRGERVLNS